MDNKKILKNIIVGIFHVDIFPFDIASKVKPKHRLHVLFLCGLYGTRNLLAKLYHKIFALVKEQLCLGNA